MSQTVHEVVVPDLAQASYPDLCATCGVARPVASVAVRAEMIGRDRLFSGLLGASMMFTLLTSSVWPAEAVVLAVGAGWLLLWMLIVRGARPEFDVPVCSACAAQVWRRRRKAESLTNALAGITAVATMLGFRVFAPETETMTVVLWTALATVPWSAANMVRRFTRPEPIVLKVNGQSATVRFSSKQYADRFAACNSGVLAAG